MDRGINRVVTLAVKKQMKKPIYFCVVSGRCRREKKKGNAKESSQADVNSPCRREKKRGKKAVTDIQ